MDNDTTLTPEEAVALEMLAAAVQQMEQSAREAREATEALRDELRENIRALEAIRQEIGNISERVARLETGRGTDTVETRYLPS